MGKTVNFAKEGDDYDALHGKIQGRSSYEEGRDRRSKMKGLKNNEMSFYYGKSGMFNNAFEDREDMEKFTKVANDEEMPDDERWCIIKFIAIPASLIFIGSAAAFWIYCFLSMLHGFPPYLSGDIAEKCSTSQIQTVEGWESCKELCMPGECCFIPSGSDGSCFENSPETCGRYQAYCTVIFETTGLGRALLPKSSFEASSSTLDFVENTCSPMNIRHPNGFFKCQQICSERECCFSTKTDNCRSQFPAWCDGFHPCTNINALSSPEEVEEACATDIDLCKSLCAERSCCFDSGSDSCYSKHTSWCDEFSVCAMLKNDVLEKSRRF